MTKEQQQVSDWMKAFGQETPEKPVIPSLEVRKLRAKLILEEALETIDSLGFNFNFSKEEPSTIEWKIANLTLMETKPARLLEIVDGCEDLKVVTEGTLIACGLIRKIEIYELGKDKEVKPVRYVHHTNDPFFDEVMESNWTKMWRSIELATMFTKGPIELETKNLKTTLIGPSLVGLGNNYVLTNKDGKIIKSPSYSPPNLQPIIDSYLL